MTAYKSRLYRMGQENVVSCQGLVVSIAEKYRGMGGLSVGELISDGNLALMNAARRYNEGGRAKFSTYAYEWIIGAMKRAVTKAIRANRIVYGLEGYDAEDDGSSRDFERVDSSDQPENQHLDPAVLASLNNKDKTIIEMRYGFNGYGRPRGLREVGRRVDLSQEGVRKREKRILADLHKVLTGEA